jgi:hypothetical protein
LPDVVGGEDVDAIVDRADDLACAVLDVAGTDDDALPRERGIDRGGNSQPLRLFRSRERAWSTDGDEATEDG